MKLAAELVRKGATMLAEPCPQCGGIQVRFRGKVHCTSHEDLSEIAGTEGASFGDVVAMVKGVLISKMGEAAHSLEAEKDLDRQQRLTALMNSYFELLEKLPGKGQSP